MKLACLTIQTDRNSTVLLQHYPQSSN